MREAGVLDHGNWKDWQSSQGKMLAAEHRAADVKRKRAAVQS